METKQLYYQRLNGTYGSYELTITVGATKLPDLEQDKIREAAYKAASLIQSEVMEAVVRACPEAMKRAQMERDELLAIFPRSILVEEIPNGYCHDWCCRHLPWFVVTTEIGRFKIGWRKRVINIEWEETRVTKTASELFPDDDVTKSGRTIHAWSLEDAKRYVQTILDADKSNDELSESRGRKKV